MQQLFENYSACDNVVIYLLDIFCKQMFHPMATSVYFAKELFHILFQHVKPDRGPVNVWNIVNVLISHHFDVVAIFDQFNSLKLLTYVT